MADRSWAITPELEGLIAKADAHGGASDWTLSSETRTRAFLAEKERLQGRFCFLCIFCGMQFTSRHSQINPTVNNPPLISFVFYFLSP